MILNKLFFFYKNNKIYFKKMYLNIFKIEREKSQKTFNRKKWKIYLKRKRKRKKGLSPLLSR
jgi:hypothetical protein